MSEATLSEKVADLERERNNLAYLYAKALEAVDRVFQTDCTKRPPLLPDFLGLGDCKFKGVVKLAKAYLELEAENARLRELVRKLRDDAFRPSYGQEGVWETEAQEERREAENRERRQEWDAETERMLAAVTHGGNERR